MSACDGSCGDRRSHLNRATSKFSFKPRLAHSTRPYPIISKAAQYEEMKIAPDSGSDKKGPGHKPGPFQPLRDGYLSPPRFLSAVPRMSPSVAPESEEPYWAMASFSSATSSALMETCTLRAFLSNWITRASTFSPTAKRSER